MAGVEYHHLGHNPSSGKLALWSIDTQSKLHVSEKRFETVGVEWLDWSHENAFGDIAVLALGRVEIDRKVGSMHIADAGFARRDDNLLRLSAILDSRFPGVRWYLFGPIFKGETLHAYLAASAPNAARAA